MKNELKFILIAILISCLVGCNDTKDTEELNVKDALDQIDEDMKQNSEEETSSKSEEVYYKNKSDFTNDDEELLLTAFLEANLFIDGDYGDQIVFDGVDTYEYESITAKYKIHEIYLESDVDITSPIDKEKQYLENELVVIFEVLYTINENSIYYDDANKENNTIKFYAYSAAPNVYKQNGAVNVKIGGGKSHSYPLLVPSSMVEFIRGSEAEGENYKFYKVYKGNSSPEKCLENFKDLYNLEKVG